VRDAAGRGVRRYRYGFLGQKPMVQALLDRMRHRCHTIRIDGTSLRSPTG